MEDAARAKGNSIWGVSGFTCPTHFVLPTAGCRCSWNNFIHISKPPALAIPFYVCSPHLPHNIFLYFSFYYINLISFFNLICFLWLVIKKILKQVVSIHKNIQSVYKYLVTYYIHKISTTAIWGVTQKFMKFLWSSLTTYWKIYLPSSPSK